MRDVMARPQHFKVPFGPEMRALTGGADFLLGQDGPEHDAQREILEAVVLRSDAPGILDNTRTVTELLLKNSGGRIDVMQDLLGRVFTETCSDYFGLDLDEPDAFADRTMSVSALIFADPFGNPETRKLALNGAVRIRWLIDRAIDRAKVKPRANTVIDRLVQYRRADGTEIDKPQIRAMAIGTIIGLIPTNTLGAGRMIEELHRRGMLQSLIGAASAAEKARAAGDIEAAKRHRGELKKMLVEASRLNPALFPGQFRHVPMATTVAGKPVPAGSVMVVGTMSALRDSRKFTCPGAFEPGRELDPALMFGEGSHVCLGAHLAMEQITEICQVLFSQPGIRLADDPDGWLAYVGPFPRRLDFVFQTTATSATQNLITIQARLDPDKVDEAQRLIAKLGNPAALDSEIGKKLQATEIVHYVSMSAFDAKDPDDKTAVPDPRLIFELNVDSDEDTVLARIVQHAGPLLEPIFDCVAGAREIDPDKLPERFNKSRLHFLLERHKTKLHFAPWGAIGLNFNGTPDTPVGDIAQQEELATFVHKAVDRYFQVHEGLAKRAMDALAYVRDLTRPAGASAYDLARLSPAEQRVEEDLRAEGQKLRGFLMRPSKRKLGLSDWTGDDTKVGLQGLPAALKSNAGLFLALLIGTTVSLLGGAIHHAVDPSSWVAYGFALVGVVTGVLLTVAMAVRDGFDTLVRWYKAWTMWLVDVGTVLAFVVSAALFIVALLIRWFRWPASILGFAAASFGALQRWFPEIPLVAQIALALLGGVAATWLIVGFWNWVVPKLLQAWRMAVLTVLGAAVAFSALQKWLLLDGWLGIPLSDWPLSGRIALAALVGLAAAYVARWLWREAQPLLRRNRLLIEWILGFGAVVGVIAAVYFYPEPFSLAVEQLGAVSLALAGGIVATVLLWLTVLVVFVAILYWHEVRDDKDIDRRTAPLDHIEAIAAKENAPGYAQNHITAVTAMKPGAFRKFTLALSLWAIGKEVQYWFRPGFVLNMGTIHYARWFRLPGSEMMVFFSNYDGSWLSYLEDFITKAHEGQTAVWSHGKGFPKSRLLVLGGAADGARFKRWVRRQQIVTQFWYSRFPSLTTDQIRTNALIHDGLMRAQTDTAARAWLDCFGTMPRPQDAIETDEVQSLVFRGLSSHDHMLSAALRLPDNETARKDWLNHLRREVTFGERPDVAEKTATFVAFSARGIATCLGRDEQDKAEKMAAFPPIFRLGMAERARVLGDTGPSAPQEWTWADVDGKSASGKAVDVVLFIYGTEAQACRDALATHETKLGRKAIWTLLTEPTRKTQAARQAMAAGAPDAERPTSERDAPMYEHFGFRDGISQPILRGTQREAAVEDKADVVEVGELLLGYRDGSGYAPMAVTLPAESDPGDELETDTPEFLSRFPRFAGSQDADLRDFGRNGTYVVVRQLMQDVDGFNDFLAVQEGALKKYPGLENSVGGEITQEWIAAKMMGRWRSGASLVSHPHEMAGSRTPDRADNDFNFATDDPQGLRCPFGAHIRRSNPRGSLAPNDPKQAMIERRHRILRRGRPYGDEKSERGLLFVALCADLERQFEFLQQSWVGSPSFQGLSHEPDPITSPPPVDPAKPFVFTIPTPSGSVTMKNLKSFVTVRAGGYFFMPSRSAIRFLAGL
ncbi:MAG: cytochrome P450 [Rhodospirillales bacterium]|nr:cytochrome P450 [Rhodospirillales bacterium]